MLVLSRKPGEKLIIADGLITVTIVRIGPNSVRLGIDCPKDINIVRDELCETSVIGGEIVTEQVRGETAEEREHRLAMDEQRSKKPGKLRHAK